MNKEHKALAEAIVSGLMPFFVQQKDKTEELEKSIGNFKEENNENIKILEKTILSKNNNDIVESIKKFEEDIETTKPVKVKNLHGLEQAQELVAKEISNLSIELKSINETHLLCTTEKTKAIEDAFLSFANQINASIEKALSSTLKVEVQNQKSFPEKITTIVSNLSEIVFPKSIKISNTDPKEAVPVRLVDRNGKKFYDAIFEVVTKNGEINLSKLDDIAKGGYSYNIVLDNISTVSVVYVGKALPGSIGSDPFWQIQRIDKRNTPTTLKTEFADGNTNFDNIWDNRLSITYL